MATAAQLLVKVSGDTGDAERKLKGIGDQVQQHQGFFKNALSSAVGYAAGAVGIASVGSAVGFLTGQLGDMIGAGMQANQVQAQTAAVLKSTHDASGMTASGVDQLATKTMNLTGINDDAVASAENILLTFTNIGKKAFPDATKATADLATSMHMDLNSAALVVGKALNDPVQGVTALRREGVQLSDQQQQMVKHFMAVGDKAGAQKIILGELSKEFGGSAEAAGKANGGMKILSAQFDNVKQTVGQKLVPILTTLLQKLSPLITSFAATLPGAIDAATNAVSTIAGKVGDFVGFLQDHQPIFDILKASLLGVGVAILATLVPAFIGWAVSAGAAAIATIVATAPVLAIGAAIGLLILGIKALISHGDQVKGFFGGIGEAVGGVLGWFGRLKDVVSVEIGDAFKKMGDTIGRVWDGITGAIKGAINGAINLINLYIGLIDKLQIHIPSINAGPIHTPAFDWNGLNIPMIPHLASGGDMASSGLALVGEYGPELVALPRGSHVYSNAQTQQMGGGGGSGGGGGAGPVFNVHVYGQDAASARGLAQNVYREMHWQELLHHG